MGCYDLAGDKVKATMAANFWRHLENLSAHADAGEILAWMRGFSQIPRHTFVTHGEPQAADTMRGRIEHDLGWPAAVPDYLQTVELT